MRVLPRPMRDSWQVCDITKGSVLKTVPKATFFASTRLISVLVRQKMPSMRLSSKSARNPGHYRLCV